MRMNAETLKRNGVVYDVCRDLLHGTEGASIKMIALTSGYTPTEVQQAVQSLKKQSVLTEDHGMVIEVHPFPRA